MTVGKTSLAEPLMEFRRLREHAPVVEVTLPSGASAWLLTRYANIRAAPADTRLRCTAIDGVPDPPPDHALLRRLLGQAFTAERTQTLRSHLQELAGQQIRLVKVAPKPVDLMSCFVLSVPIKVIMELLGVPEEDRDELHAWSEVIVNRDDHLPDEVRRARTKVLGYLAELISARRAKPTDDLLGELMRSRYESNTLSEAELLDFALIMLTACYQSISNVLGIALFALLAHPEQLALLRAEPDLVPHAVEELHRFNPLVFTGTQLRVATEEVKLAGVTIRAGDGVITALGSADYDILSDPFGAQLARLILDVAITTLISELPGTLRFAVPAHWLTCTTDRTSCALANLPVTW
ncbi:MAG: cytochrome P450 [Pseudonocardiaceae bacterium]